MQIETLIDEPMVYGCYIQTATTSDGAYEEHNLQKVRETIPKAALYEQLAEECSELAQASLKMARKLRNENYTPVPMNEISENLIEEFSDVVLCAATLQIHPSDDIIKFKMDRWSSRNASDED